MGMTERVGLLGWPVEHSRSPSMHNAAFAALSLDWTYDLLPVPPQNLGAEVARLIREGYRGFNVTVPHKQAVLRDCPCTPDDAVNQIGAANTLIVQPDGTLAATNTDWRGFADDLRANGIDPAGKRCLILGTGGAARAVSYALHHESAAAITFVSRDPLRSALTPAITYDDLPAQDFDLLVNTTPVGLWPAVDR
jgi:shikimate dehydrogenase